MCTNGHFILYESILGPLRANSSWKENRDNGFASCSLLNHPSFIWWWWGGKLHVRGDHDSQQPNLNIHQYRNLVLFTKFASAPLSHMPPHGLPKLLPPNLPTSHTQIKRVIAQWIALPIMEDVGCSLTPAKMTNPNIVKATAKSPCLTCPMN